MLPELLEVGMGSLEGFPLNHTSIPCPLTELESNCHLDKSAFVSGEPTPKNRRRTL